MSSTASPSGRARVEWQASRITRIDPPRRAAAQGMSSMGSQSVVVRFAGDSGDGVQLMGTQFVAATALAGNDFATFPDYPAEIRAPAGTTFGVSAYQIHLGARPITTAGDAPQVLVAFNPAALKVNLPLVASGALIVLNVDSFTSRGLAKAGYQTDPRKSGELDGYQVVEVDMTQATLDATKEFELSKSDAGRCKNFWALGLVQWMFNHDISQIQDWIAKKFAKDAKIRDANLAALRAGHAYGETAELAAAVPHVKAIEAQFPPGEYRGVRGAEALSLGLAAAGALAVRPPRRGHVPSRRRDRGRLRRDRRVVWRRDRRHVELGPGHRAQDRGDRTCDQHRASGRDHRLAARRPFDRLADEDRAVRSLPGGLRPQRRRADPGDRRGHPERLLRGRDRSRANCAQAHDAGDASDRRLSRERCGAVAHTGRGQDPEDRDERRQAARAGPGDRRGDLQSRPGVAWAAVGRPRHAGSDVQGRRPREGPPYRQHL